MSSWATARAAAGRSAGPAARWPWRELDPRGRPAAARAPRCRGRSRRTSARIAASNVSRESGAVSRRAKPGRNTRARGRGRHFAHGAHVEPSRPLAAPARRPRPGVGGDRGAAAGPGAASGRVRRATRPAVRPAPAGRRVVPARPLRLRVRPGGRLAGRRAREEGSDGTRPPRLADLQGRLGPGSVARARIILAFTTWAATPSSSARGLSSAWRGAILRSRRWFSSTRRSTRWAWARTLPRAARSLRASRSAAATGRPQQVKLPRVAGYLAGRAAARAADDPRGSRR